MYLYVERNGVSEAAVTEKIPCGQGVNTGGGEDHKVRLS